MKPLAKAYIGQLVHCGIAPLAEKQGRENHIVLMMGSPEEI